MAIDLIVVADEATVKDAEDLPRRNRISGLRVVDIAGSHEAADRRTTGRPGRLVACRS
jgi:CBS domain-containing protein